MENYAEAEKYFLPGKYNIDKDNFICTTKYLGYIYSRNKKKEYEKIIEMYTNALNFDDEDIDCYIELAILNELRKPEESIKLYEKAIELIKKKDLKNYVFNRTRSLYDIKEDFPKILNNYATIRLRLGYLNGLERILNEALSIIKNNKNDIKNFKDNEEKKDYFIEEVFFFK
jgi:tetratricopeptide (TPR) repeat protein